MRENKSNMRKQIRSMEYCEFLCVPQILNMIRGLWLSYLKTYYSVKINERSIQILASQIFAVIEVDVPNKYTKFSNLKIQIAMSVSHDG